MGEATCIYIDCFFSELCLLYGWSDLYIYWLLSQWAMTVVWVKRPVYMLIVISVSYDCCMGEATCISIDCYFSELWLLYGWSDLYIYWLLFQWAMTVVWVKRPVYLLIVISVSYDCCMGEATCISIDCYFSELWLVWVKRPVYLLIVISVSYDCCMGESTCISIDCYLSELWLLYGWSDLYICWLLFQWAMTVVWVKRPVYLLIAISVSYDCCMGEATCISIDCYFSELWLLYGWSDLYIYWLLFQWAMTVVWVKRPVYLLIVISVSYDCCMGEATCISIDCYFSELWLLYGWNDLYIYWLLFQWAMTVVWVKRPVYLLIAISVSYDSTINMIYFLSTDSSLSSHVLYSDILIANKEYAQGSFVSNNLMLSINYIRFGNSWCSYNLSKLSI